MYFGLVHLAENTLTRGLEHFDLPGIQAARLEAVAEADQILCTETVYKIFSQHYLQMFSESPRSIQTKDAAILAYEVFPFDSTELQKLFSTYFFRHASDAVQLTGKRTKILIVDDERMIRRLVEQIIGQYRPDIKTITASSGEEALEVWRPKEFLPVLTDQMMSGLSGLDITREMIAQDPDQNIVMLTGWGSVAMAVSFMQAGGTDFLTKPFDLEQISEVLRQALTGHTLQTIRTNLGILCEDTGSMLLLLRGVSEQLNTNLAAVSNSNDTAHGLLRHKAKQLIGDFVRSILPAQDITVCLSKLQTQLTCVQRLSNIIGRVQVGEIGEYLYQYVGALLQLYPGVEFTLACSPSQSSSLTISNGTEVIMIVCELIDNALHAINRSGQDRRYHLNPESNRNCTNSG